MRRTINKACTQKRLDCTLLALTALCNVLLLSEMPMTNYLSAGLIKINEASVMGKGKESEMKKVGCFETCCEARINEMYIALRDGVKKNKKKQSTVLRVDRRERERNKERNRERFVAVHLFNLFGFPVSCLELQMVQWIWCLYTV